MNKKQVLLKTRIIKTFLNNNKKKIYEFENKRNSYWRNAFKGGY